jgi:hypothetical protein
MGSCGILVGGSRLYSGNPGSEPIGVKADDEWVCSSSETSTSGSGNVGGSKEEGNEVSMDSNLNCKVERYGRFLVEWLNNNSFKIVLVLSLLHIGLSYIHTQHSGRADYRILPV